MYLLDTNVLSDLNPDKPGHNRQLVDWLRRHGDLCYLSTVTLTEVAYGVASLRSRDATARAAGVEPDTTDAWIAATAKIHNLEVLTLNLADFRPMAIASRNPVADPLPD